MWTPRKQTNRKGTETNANEPSEEPASFLSQVDRDIFMKETKSLGEIIERLQHGLALRMVRSGGDPEAITELLEKQFTVSRAHAVQGRDTGLWDGALDS